MSVPAGQAVLTAYILDDDRTEVLRPANTADTALGNTAAAAARIRYVGQEAATPAAD
jgi:hypothetical protein